MPSFSARGVNSRRSSAPLNRLTLILFTLLALALRVWALDAKGLAYDEAATALMARATPLEIIQFHWHASFEHPPFWQLLMHFWSELAGQSEFALRFLPALAGVLLIPLCWQLAHTLDFAHASVPWLSSLLTLFSPILLLYSQEARMYTIVVAFALASLLAWRRLVMKPGVTALIIFLLLTWVMLGFHYYSVLLLVGEQIVAGCLLLPVRPFSRRAWLWFIVTTLLAVLPLLLWMTFSPGFRITASIVLQGAGAGPLGAGQFLDELWRDLTFGAIRWQPQQAILGYLLLPLLAIGCIKLVAPAQRGAWEGQSHAEPGNEQIQNRSTEDFSELRRAAHERPKSQIQNYLGTWWPIFIVLMPILVSTLLFRTLATRYILFVMPLLYLISAVGIAWLWRYQRVLGFVAFVVAGVVAGAGILYYFGPYQKSEYRQMATYLTVHAAPEDGILLEAPRQHLLAKYYLSPHWPLYTAPAVVLPAYWPISAPPVVPEKMDGQIQAILRKHPALWLVLTAEDEVDKGEFVQKYLTAVAYKADCATWLDVNLCAFISPHFVHGGLSTKFDALWAKELLLKSAAVTATGSANMTGTKVGSNDTPTLLVQLNWRAAIKPTHDYRVTLRLVDGTGHVISQRDDYPIGPLLPPSTWNMGDEKPGFMALPIPANLSAGDYQVVMGLYDPATTALLAYNRGDRPGSNDPVVLANVEIGDKIGIHQP